MIRPLDKRLREYAAALREWKSHNGQGGGGGKWIPTEQRYASQSIPSPEAHGITEPFDREMAERVRKMIFP